MTGSFIHMAFDPQPYVVLSTCAIAMGVALEVGWTGDTVRRVSGYFQRSVTRHGLHAGGMSGVHSLGIAER
jgi:hypothetical protein